MEDVNYKKLMFFGSILNASKRVIGDKPTKLMPWLNPFLSAK